MEENANTEIDRDVERKDFVRFTKKKISLNKN